MNFDVIVHCDDAISFLNLIYFHDKLSSIHQRFSVLFTGDNGRIEYSITAGDEDDFEIVPNGTIYTKRLLDRETKSTYNLVVTARDSAKDIDKRLSSTVQVKTIFFSFHTFNFNNLFVSTIHFGAIIWLSGNNDQALYEKNL